MSLENKKRIFICAEHGRALVYFLQSEVVKTLLAGGAELVLLTDDEALPAIEARFRQPGVAFEGMRLGACKRYFATKNHFLQYWLHVLRGTGGSNRVNTTAIDGNYQVIVTAARGRRKLVIPVIRVLVWLMRRSRAVRQAVVGLQRRFTPSIYTDLFEKHRPDLVLTSTPGWLLDRYLLREAAARGVPTATVIVGWDNPSSYRLNGGPVDEITCWSEIHKEELVQGADWDPGKVAINGNPAYDGYFRKEWLIGREEYFRLHGLDPQRRLLAYACSFETFHPNFQNIAAIADLVNQEALDQPCQLLIRLHPNHFQPGSRFEGEANRVRDFIRAMPHVRLVEPVSLSGSLGHYSGEDMPEKTSMMAHADVFLTVYSTMVVETAIHDRPIVAVCIDVPGGWNLPGIYSLPLTAIGDWPTHLRFRQAGAGRVAVNKEELRRHINAYLADPQLDSAARRKFVQDECTFVDGSAGRRTGEYILSLLERK